MANLDVTLLLDGVDAWNKWRKDARQKAPELADTNLSKANLSNANLSRANLTASSFIESNLSGASIVGANLSGANLIGANLRGADLSEANLSGTYLNLADLSGANLGGANLTLANLSGANLSGAMLTEAICSGTIFGNVDLSTTIGIEMIRHHGPSNLGIDSIFKTNKALPEIFLRGCGVPEIMITFLPSMMGRAIEFYSCFISYSHADKSFAQRVHDTLQAQGIRCWLDEKEILPGEPIEEAIASGIRYSDKVLLCASKHSLKSWWVDNELDNLFEKERKLQRERGKSDWLLIPLDIDGYLHKPEYESGKKAQIRKRLAANFKGWKRNNAIFEREIERVIKALRTDGGKEPPPIPKL